MKNKNFLLITLAKLGVLLLSLLSTYNAHANCPEGYPGVKISAGNTAGTCYIEITSYNGDSTITTGTNTTLDNANKIASGAVQPQVDMSTQAITYSPTGSTTQGENAALKTANAGLTTSNQGSDSDCIADNSCYEGMGEEMEDMKKNQAQKEAGGADAAPPTQAQIDECSSQRVSTEKWCDIENDGFAVMAQMMIGSMGSTISDSCDGAANVTYLTSGLSTALASKCQYHISRCTTACLAVKNQTYELDGETKTGQNYHDFCDVQTMNYQKLMLSAAQALQAHYSAKQCELTTQMQDELTACTSADTMSDPSVCPSIACDFNTYPQNQGHAACPTSAVTADLSIECQGANAQYNPACAPCFSANPPASCPADIGSGYGGGSDFNDALNGDQYDYDGLGNALTDEDFFNPEFDGFDGETAGQAALASGGNVGNAGGLGSASGGGGGGSAGGGAGGGSGDSGIDTDILGRLSGSSGGGGGGGGFSGGYASGAGSAWKKNGRGVGSATQKDNFDLSKFLNGLGGKKNSRATASLSSDQKLSQAGITKANGLSNFQKVTRMINKKRVSLDK